MTLAAGDAAPTFFLDDIATGQQVTNPWQDGPVALAFYKTTCPVCQMVAPVLAAMGEGGVRVVAIGQDPAATLAGYAERFGQDVPTVSEPAPYRVADAYGITSVPTLFLVDGEGVIQKAVGAWDRDKWNEVAAAFGAPPASTPGDGLPPFRPG